MRKLTAFLLMLSLAVFIGCSDAKKPAAGDAAAGDAVAGDAAADDAAAE